VLVRRGPSKRRRRVRLTPFGWLVVALIAGFGIAGLVTGSPKFWFVGLVLLALALVMAVGIPRSVHDLEVPPGMPNAPGDPTSHEEDL
jgi:peptidoglycan/LPS O-acetylase OafA/YrhL